MQIIRGSALPEHEKPYEYKNLENYTSYKTTHNFPPHIMFLLEHGSRRRSRCPHFDDGISQWN